MGLRLLRPHPGSPNKALSSCKTLQRWGLLRGAMGGGQIPWATSLRNWRTDLQPTYAASLSAGNAFASMLDHFSRSELACPTTDQVRLAVGFGEALEHLRVELDEPVYLSYACEAGCYSFLEGDDGFFLHPWLVILVC